MSTATTKSSLCDYSDRYIRVKGALKITGARTDAAARETDERDKGAIFKNCATFADCIREINNSHIDNVKGHDVVMRMYSLIEYTKKIFKNNRKVIAVS